MNDTGLWKITHNHEVVTYTGEYENAIKLAKYLFGSDFEVTKVDFK